MIPHVRKAIAERRARQAVAGPNIEDVDDYERLQALTITSGEDVFFEALENVVESQAAATLQAQVHSHECVQGACY